MTRRIFKHTRPRYGTMWHSISYRRGWMPVLSRGRVYNPYGRSIAAMRHASLFSMKRYPKRLHSLLDELRIRMMFRSYNVRHPNAKKWRSR